MVAVTRFEDLIVWQKARHLAKEVHSVCATGRIAHDYALTDQMRRSSVSIVSNIAEGFERRNAGYFGQFLSYARGSCAELRTQLYLGSDVGWLCEKEFSRVSLLAAEVARMLGALYESQIVSRRLHR
jgi:four helix bundle protein